MRQFTQKPFILFVTGVSTAGKTTLYNKLKQDKELSHVDIHDIDENGVPPVGLTPWRAFRIEELLYTAAQHAKDEVPSIICGVSFPDEIIGSNYYSKVCNIHFLLLEIPYNTFKKRIDARIDEAKAKGSLSDNLKGEHYRGLLGHTKRLIKKFDDSVSNQRNGHIINSSTLSAENVLDETKMIIGRIGRQ
jgi:adenylate kinase family enzyme